MAKSAKNLEDSAQQNFKKWLPVIGVLLFVGVGVAMIFMTSDDTPQSVSVQDTLVETKHSVRPPEDTPSQSNEVAPADNPPPQHSDDDQPLPRYNDDDDEGDIKPPDIPKALDNLLDDDDDDHGKPAPLSRPDDN